MQPLPMQIAGDFDKKVSEQKWDRVEVVLMQRFARRVQFGLSFIHLNSLSETVTIVDDPFTFSEFKNKMTEQLTEKERSIKKEYSPFSRKM